MTALSRVPELTPLARVFWGVAAVNGLLIAGLLVMSLQSNAGAHDGGRAMGLFSFVALPALAWLGAVLLFHFTAPGSVAKWVALFVVLVPGLVFAKLRIDDFRIDRRVADNRSGAGYFDSEPTRAMGAAVVARDVATLARLGPTVDVNAPGRGTTLMALAVEPGAGRDAADGDWPVVHALLALGAAPTPAMGAALHDPDARLLALLLAAGADPNGTDAPGGEPFVFQAMGSLTEAHFLLMVQHGLDLDARSRLGWPLAVQLAIARRWDLLLLALQRGADPLAARPDDGRTARSELDAQIAQEQAAGREPPQALRQARAALDAPTRAGTPAAPASPRAR